MPARLPLIQCPVLLIAATDDPHAYPAVGPLSERLPTSTVAEIEGGLIALPDQLPEAFANAVLPFLDGLELSVD